MVSHRKCFRQSLFILILLVFLLTSFLSLGYLAYGKERTSPQQIGEAKLLEELTVTLSDGQDPASLLDQDYNTSVTLAAGETITVESKQDMAHLYLIWNRIPGEWDLTLEGRRLACGTQGFLHEYVDLAERLSQGTRKITIHVPGDHIPVSDVMVFTAGTLPNWVQRWQAPYEKADLLLLPTHSDDEHLYFAGILPTYAGDRGYRVQVVYLTNHWDKYDRPHELLNGLWTVGVTAYPVISDFLDKYASSVNDAKEIYDEEAMLAFQVEMLRRFKPLVVVGHDKDGEYGHGVHILNSELLRQAVTISMDETKFPESAAKYGLWDVPKTYIHVWPENPVVMDWDVPLEAFGGRTAYQMSCEGFRCHVTQQYDEFVTWLMGPRIEKAADIQEYSCCDFGLFRTTVGLDTGRKDLMENVTPWDVLEATPTSEPSETLSPTPYAGTPANVQDEIDQSESFLWVAVGILVFFILWMIIRRRMK